MSEVVHIRDLGDHVACLTMDDPDTDNRLTDAMCQQLLAALATLAADESNHALVLAGRQDVFCAGAALELIERLAAGDGTAKDLALPQALLDFPVPIIAAAQGHAVGGGLTLAVCCDLVVGAEERRYGANFTSMGFTPGMGTTALLPHRVGHHFAGEMLFTAQHYKGRDLAGRGLFNHIVPAAEVMPMAIDIARRIADKPRHVLELLKAALVTPRREELEAAFEREQAMHRVCFGKPGVASAIKDGYLA